MLLIIFCSFLSSLSIKVRICSEGLLFVTSSYFTFLLDFCFLVSFLRSLKVTTRSRCIHTVDGKSRAKKPAETGISKKRNEATAGGNNRVFSEVQNGFPYEDILYRDTSLILAEGSL